MDDEKKGMSKKVVLTVKKSEIKSSVIVPKQMAPSVGSSGKKKLIIGIVAVGVIVGLLIGSYFMFFSEPSTPESKFREELKPVMGKLDELMEMSFSSVMSSEDLGDIEDLFKIETRIVEINDLGDGRLEAIIHSEISALGVDEALVTKFYYDVSEDRIVTAIMDDDEQPFEVFIASIDVVLALGIEGVENLN